MTDDSKRDRVIEAALREKDVPYVWTGCTYVRTGCHHNRTWNDGPEVVCADCGGVLDEDEKR